MTRPPWEVADVIRIAGSRFRERYGASLTWPQVKVLRAIARCRTAALGGHLDVCTGCGYVAGISYNSCRNRHCPKCQTGAREKWLAKRQQELLPVNYFHLVFSVPHLLAPLIWQNKRHCSLSCSMPLLPVCWKLPRTQSISVRRSAFSASCTPVF